NYLDGNLMLNAVASKMALLLEMPYTNTMIPVDVTLNGEYIGNYMFTEHKEVEKNRINVTDGGVLLELDVYYDEEWKFKSAHYELPVMIQYPELEDYSIDDAISEQEKIRADFQILEDAIFDDSFPNSNYLDYMDADALVNYLIVYNLTRNGEINHPKSTYIHKQKEGKYRMGPIWDFDWAFDFNGTDTYFRSATNPLLGNNGIGGRFFSRILVDPEIQDLYRQKWTAFKNDKFPELLSYIDEYADLIKLSQKLDYERWQRGSGDFMEDVQRLRTWVMDRASYIDDYIINFN
ncbi:MAG TPA: CotH kinase family protein, partial [Arenibacter sp.]|nr:CotH kinase family protein [Arenibacter sp.]